MKNILTTSRILLLAMRKIKRDQFSIMASKVIYLSKHLTLFLRLFCPLQKESGKTLIQKLEP